MLTPGNFERAVSYEALARYLNLSVCDGTLKSTICPRCSADVAHIYKDYETSGWRWFCSKCRFSGSSIQLYQELKDIPVIRTAIYALISDLVLSINNGTLENQIAEYVLFRDHKDELNQLIQRCRLRLAEEMPLETVQLLEKLDIWNTSVPHELKRTLCRFAGSLSWFGAKTLGSVLGFPISRGNFSWANSVVLPYEMTPGQYSSFLLVDHELEFKHILATGSLREGGVLGLSEATTIEDDVFALVDPILFLYMRIHWFDWNVDDSACGFIAYCGKSRSYFSTTTALAFNALKAKRVIFWDYNVNIDGINAARVLKERGYIALKPRCSEFASVKSALHMYTYDQFVRQLRESAVPWYTALRRLLLTIDSSQRQLVLGQLTPALSHEELELIKADCPPGDWLKLSVMLHQTPIARTTQYGKLVFSLRPKQGIYQLSTDPRNLQETQIADVDITFNEVIMTEDSRYLSGVIQSQDKVIEFKDEEQVMRKNFVRWLDSKCLEAGIVPQIDRKRGRDLFAIAFNLSRPRVISAITRVGWSTDRWRFVQFEVSGGELVASPRDSSLFKIPTAKLAPSGHFPPHTVVKTWEQKPYNLELAINLIVFMSYNLIQARESKPKSGLVAAVKHFEGLAAFASEFNLQAYTQRKSMTTERMNEFKAIVTKHDVPTLVTPSNFDSDYWVTWLDATDHAVILSGLSLRQVCNVAAYSNWVVLTSRDDGTGLVDGVTELFGYVFPRLTKLQNPTIGNLWNAVRGMLLEGGLNPVTISQLKLNIFTVDRDRWEMLFWCLFFVQHTKNKVAGIDLTDEHVRINWTTLRSTLEKMKLFVPDPVMLDQTIPPNVGIEKTSDGWLLPKKTWDRLYVQWTELFAELLEST